MKSRNRFFIIFCVFKILLLSQTYCKDLGTKVTTTIVNSTSTKLTGKPPTAAKLTAQVSDSVVESTNTTTVEFTDIKSIQETDDYVVVEEESVVYVTEVDDGPFNGGNTTLTTTTIVDYETDGENATHVVTVSSGDDDTHIDRTEVIIVDGNEIPLDPDANENVIIVVDGEYDYDSGNDGDGSDTGQEIVVIIEEPEPQTEAPIVIIIDGPSETTTTTTSTSPHPKTTTTTAVPTTTTTVPATTTTQYIPPTTKTSPTTTTVVATTPTTSTTTQITSTTQASTTTKATTTTQATTTKATTTTQAAKTTQPSTTTTAAPALTTAQPTQCNPGTGNCSCGCSIIINNNNHNYYNGPNGVSPGQSNHGNKTTNYHVIRKNNPKSSASTGRQGRAIVRKIGNKQRLANSGPGIRRRYLTRNLVTRNLGKAAGTGNVQVYRVLKQGPNQKPLIVKNLRKRANPVFRLQNAANGPKVSKRMSSGWRVVRRWKAQGAQKLIPNTRIGTLEQRRVVRPNVRRQAAKVRTAPANAGKRLKYNNNVMRINKRTGNTYRLAELKLGLTNKLKQKRKVSKQFVQKKP